MADIHTDSDSEIVSLTDGSGSSWMDDVDSAKNGQTPPNQENTVARSKGSSSATSEERARVIAATKSQSSTMKDPGAGQLLNADPRRQQLYCDVEHCYTVDLGPNISAEPPTGSPPDPSDTRFALVPDKSESGETMDRRSISRDDRTSRIPRWLSNVEEATKPGQAWSLEEERGDRLLQASLNELAPAACFEPLLGDQEPEADDRSPKVSNTKCERASDSAQGNPCPSTESCDKASHTTEPSPARSPTPSSADVYKIIGDTIREVLNSSLFETCITKIDQLSSQVADLQYRLKNLFADTASVDGITDEDYNQLAAGRPNSGSMTTSKLSPDKCSPAAQPYTPSAGARYGRNSRTAISCTPDCKICLSQRTATYLDVPESSARASQTSIPCPPNCAECRLQPSTPAPTYTQYDRKSTSMNPSAQYRCDTGNNWYDVETDSDIRIAIDFSEPAGSS